MAYWKYVQAYLLVSIALIIAIFLFPSFTLLSFLVSIVAYLVVSVILVMAYVKLLDGDWEHLLDRSFLDMEKITIQLADGKEIVARVFKRKNATENKSPAIIVHHGLSGYGKKQFKLACPLAMRGYITILPDCRGHGDSKKLFKASMDDWYIDDATGIIPDLHKIVDYVVSRDDIDPNRLAMIGHSMGGMVTLTSGLLDERIKLNVAMSAPHSFVGMLEAKRGKKVLTEPWFSKHFLRLVISFSKLEKINEKISPEYYFKQVPKERIIDRVRLVHAKNDHLVLFEESALKIQDALHLPPENVFFLEEGDHSLRGQETTILMKILGWLEAKFP